jgi:hypothetical protein
MRPPVYVLAVLAVACTTPVPTGAPPLFVPPEQVVDLKLDDQPFQLASCASGRPDGFHGAELRGQDGTRIRLVSEIDGSSEVVVFRPGQDEGVVLKHCSRMEIKELSSRSSSSIRGRARILCFEQNIHLEGTVILERCAG